MFHLGYECNLTIIISNINWCAVDSGLESIQKKGTIIRTEIRARMAQYRTDVSKMNGCRTRSLTMGPVLGRRKLTGRLMMCWMPRQVGQSRISTFGTNRSRIYLRNSEFDKKRRYRRHHEGSQAGTRVTNRGDRWL